jgi:glutamate--cysteine ligase catalytic subunit
MRILGLWHLCHAYCWLGECVFAVREHGILQFLNIYNTVKSRENDCLMWGDEIEYHIIRFDDEDKTVKVSLTAEKILADLADTDAKALADGGPLSAWHPEFGSWMVEGVCSDP